MCQRHSNICGTLSSQLTARSTASGSVDIPFCPTFPHRCHPESPRFSRGEGSAFRFRVPLSRGSQQSQASLKTRRDSACVVAMKTIGQCWLRPLDWHVRFGRKMQTSSEPASRHGQQIASRFFLRHKHSQPNPRRAENPIARLYSKKKFCANDVIPAYESYYKRVLSES